MRLRIGSHRTGNRAGVGWVSAIIVAALALGGCAAGHASSPESAAPAQDTPATPALGEASAPEGTPAPEEGAAVEGIVDLAHQDGVTRLCLRWAESDPPQCHDGVEVHGDIAWDALGFEEEYASAPRFVVSNVRVVGRYASGVLTLSEAPSLAQPPTYSPRAHGGAPEEELEAARKLIETRFPDEMSDGRLLVFVDRLDAGKAHLTVDLVGPEPAVEGALADLLPASVPEEAWHVQRMLDPR